MYSWQFINTKNKDKAVFIFAESYAEACAKMDTLCLDIPGYSPKDWEVEEIIEIED